MYVDDVVQVASYFLSRVQIIATLPEAPHTNTVVIQQGTKQRLIIYST
jgi:hypothetical protein